MARKWAFLRPYWSVIEAHDPHIVPEILPRHLQRTARCLSVGFPPFSDDFSAKTDLVLECRKLRDALELVLLLSIVDRESFTETLQGLLSEHDQPHLFAWGDQPFSFPCHVDLVRADMYSHEPTIERRFTKWMVAAATGVLVPQQLQQRDLEFQVARRKILAAISQKRHRDTHTVRDAGDLDWIWREMRAGDKQSTFRDHTTGPRWLELGARYTGNRVPFGSAYVDARIAPSATFLRSLPRLEKAFSTSGGLLRLREICVNTSAIHDSVSYGKMLAALTRLVVATSSSAVDTGRADSRTTFVPTLPATPQLFGQLCSALMHAREITELHLNWCSFWRGQDDTLPRDARWIMYALFSRFARHGIQQLQLRSLNLTSTEAAAARRFAMVSHPAAHLFLDEHEQSGACSRTATQVYVGPKTRLVQHSTAGTHSPKSFQLVEAAWLDVIVDDSDDEEHCRVLVPAFGDCHVRRGDIVQQRELDHDHETADADRLNSHGITSLNIYQRSFRDDHYTGLFRAAGRVLAASVDELSIAPVSVQLDSLAHILNGYESGRCRLTSLGLDFLDLSPHSSSLVPFFQALADPTTVIAQTLRELSLDLDNYLDGSLLVEAEVLAIETMLTTNATLRFVSLSLNEESMSTHGARFLQFHHQWIPRARGAPLSKQAQWAFLSVVDHSAATSGRCANSNTKTRRRSMRTKMVPPAAMGRLDSVLIKQIFCMAAEPAKRHVRITQ